MYIIKNKSFILSTLAILTMVWIPGCRKIIEVELPIDQYTQEATFATTGTAVKAVNGIYGAMARDMVKGVGISIRRGVMADEIKAIGGNEDYTWDYDGAGDIDILNFWSIAYRTFIYRINSALEGIEKSTGLSASTKRTLTGELLFSRAWMYFLLLNSYGDVPLVLSTDLNKNATITRSSTTAVYQAIEKDLLQAQQLLDDSYLESNLVTQGAERVRPNKNAATALLARIYLYTEQWAEAEKQATKLIDHADYELLPDLDQVFLMNNRESIWQLQTSDKDPEGFSTPDGRSLISYPGTEEVAYPVNEMLLNAFEFDDQRRTQWIGINVAGTPHIHKYKAGWYDFEKKEYTVVFRLAEQYLIRAEARAKQNKLTGDNSAASDLNRIRKRAGLANAIAVSQDGLLTAIDHERQVELFLEWGDRWFNLKRRKKIDEAMRAVASIKNAQWQSHKALLPIPWTEFLYNSSLRGQQNPGYREQ